jgi:hypothetical protein
MTSEPAISKADYTECRKFCTQLTSLWDQVQVTMEEAQNFARQATQLKRKSIYPLQCKFGAWLAEQCPEFSGYIPEFNMYVRLIKCYRDPEAAILTELTDNDPRVRQEFTEEDENGVYYWFANFSICNSQLVPPEDD